jgi:hypothetical protein
MSYIFDHAYRMGWTELGILEWDYEDWQFDETIIWMAGPNEFYMAHDSGCSCPIPFDLHEVGDIEGPLTKDEALTKLLKKIPVTLDKLSGQWYNDDDRKHFADKSAVIVQRILIGD